MNYVVSDTTLTSVADAIREKGGTSEELQFPQEWIEAIQGIGGKGKYKGSFTLTADATMPTITHNLGTDKIAVLIFPADNSTVIPHAGYITYSVVYINLNALLGGRTITLDYTKYNSTRFPEPLTKTVSTANTGFRFSNGNPSPWTSQSGWEQGNYSGAGSGHTATATTYRYTAKKMAQGTYDVFIWALE